MRVSSIVILILFLAAIALGIWYFLPNSEDSQAVNTHSSDQAEDTSTDVLESSQQALLSETEPPAANGEIDTVIEALLGDALVEEGSLSAYDDQDFVAEDAQSLVDFGQTFTESDL